MKLYMHPMSGCSARVLSFLAHHPEIELEMVHVALEKGAHKQPDYLAKNPMGLVPYLEFDGDAGGLSESVAILRYLMQRHAPEALLPDASLEERARLDQWTCWGLVHLGGALSALNQETGLKRMRGEEPDEAKVALLKKHVFALLDKLDERLATSQGAYVFGERPSLADYVMAPNLLASCKISGIEPPERIVTWMHRFAS